MTREPRALLTGIPASPVVCRQGHLWPWVWQGNLTKPGWKAVSRKDSSSRKCPECSAEPGSSMGATARQTAWSGGRCWSRASSFHGQEREKLQVLHLHSQLLLRVPAVAWLHSLRTFCWVGKMIPQRRILSAAATVPQASGKAIEKRARAKVQLHTWWAVLYLQ